MNLFIQIRRWRARTLSNAPQTERAKILFQFALMTVMSLIMGGAIRSFVSGDFFTASVHSVATHFEKIFINCSTAYDYIVRIALYSLSDVILLLVICASSFSILNYVISDAVLVYNGVKFGFCATLLWGFISNDLLVYNIGFTRYLVFVFFKSATILLILNYAYRAALYSIKFKRTDSLGRSRIKPRELFPFLVNTSAYVGMLLILNAIYCWLIYILK